MPIRWFWGFWPVEAGVERRRGLSDFSTKCQQEGGGRNAGAPSWVLKTLHWTVFCGKPHRTRFPAKRGLKKYCSARLEGKPPDPARDSVPGPHKGELMGEHPPSRFTIIPTDPRDSPGFIHSHRLVGGNVISGTSAYTGGGNKPLSQRAARKIRRFSGPRSSSPMR